MSPVNRNIVIVRIILLHTCANTRDTALSRHDTTRNRLSISNSYVRHVRVSACCGIPFRAIIITSGRRAKGRGSRPNCGRY